MENQKPFIKMMIIKQAFIILICVLLVQSNPPDQSKLSNWLPAPGEEFSLYQRCYWPEEIILNGNWNPPPVIKSNSK
jgi:hypothetical protein